MAGPAVEAGVCPYTASYDSTYTVIKTDGHWVVDSVKATPLDPVK
jgi:hypothetical protein